MKFHRSASMISIYFLLTLSWCTLLTNASNENETITLILNLNNNVLGRCIINQFLTIQDILNLRTTCHLFESLLTPNDEGMLNFCNWAECKAIINVDLYWINLEYFLNESYDNALYEMKIFSVSENQYAILTHTPDQKILSWFKKKVKHNIHSAPSITVNVYKNASRNDLIAKFKWVEFLKGGRIEKHGHMMKTIPYQLTRKTIKIKTIVSTAKAFAALLDNGDVILLNGGSQSHAFPHPDEMQIQLKNIKMIYSNNFKFVAVSEYGKAYSWDRGHPEILDVGNVKAIFSTDSAFAALLDDGSVRAWGNENNGGKIPSDTQSKLKKIKMIFSNDGAFVALLQDGSSVSWGNIHTQECLQKSVLNFYNNGDNMNVEKPPSPPKTKSNSYFEFVEKFTNCSMQNEIY